MHDAKGRPLKSGDIVLVPCRVVTTQPSEDYCNVQLESLYGRRPDGAKETLYAINTGVTLRDNAGDTNDWPELREARGAV